VSNGGIFMNHQLGNLMKEAVVAYSKTCHMIFLKGQRESTIRSVKMADF
jgi:hypothetical protein